MYSNHPKENIRGKISIWRHVILISRNKNDTICRYCNLELQNGEITYFIYHLTSTYPKKNGKPCPNMLPQ